MTELSNDLLCQLIDQSTKNASTLGELRSDMKTMMRSQDETKASVKSISHRVTKIERSNIRTTGFLAGVQFVLTSIGVFIAKKFRIL